MSCNIPTLNISVEDCAGDAAGKHNYNALVLDTLICNLSSTIITQDNSIGTVFEQLSGLVDNFVDIFPEYTDEKTYEFLTASTTVNLLSSIWQNNEFSLILPINGSNLYPDPSNIIDTPAIQKFTTVLRPITSTTVTTIYEKGEEVKLSFNTEYFIEDYESAVASCKNAGTINLIFDGVTVATYKARNVNKKGGVDTYVSWNHEYITTWEDNKKYQLDKKINFGGGVKFKFTKDKKGSKHSITAVKRGAKTFKTNITESSKSYQSIDDIESLSKIQSRALTYLNRYFNPKSFRDLTIVNLNILISDIVANPSNPKQLISEEYVPVTFNRSNRSTPMTAVFNRDNIYIKKNVILKYQVQNNIWNYIGKIE